MNELQERYMAVVSDAPEGSVIELDEIAATVIVHKWGEK